MTVRHVALIVLSSLVLSCWAAASAVAQQDPFGPVPQAPAPQPDPAPAPTTTGPGDDGLNRTQEILIGVAGIVLLLGIGYAIVRDAREAAPVDDEHPIDETDRPRGTRAPKAQRVKQNRSKAKAARNARKRNR